MHTGKQSGFTLLEMMIGLTVLTITFASLGLSSRTAADALAEKAHAENLSTRLHRSIERILDPLVELDLGALLPVALDAGSSTIRYHVPTGWAAGIQWGPDQNLALEIDPGEVDDGVDNDGDGLIDECQVVLTVAPGTANELRVVICKGVAEFLEGETANGVDDNGNGFEDEGGFFVDVQDDLLTVRLTLERMASQGLIQRTVTSAVRIRN